MNELGSSFHVALLRSKVVEINRNMNAQVRKNARDGLDEGVGLKVERAREMVGAIKDIIESAQVEKQDRARLLGVIITRAGAIRVMGAMAGAVASGLVKLALTDKAN